VAHGDQSGHVESAAQGAIAAIERYTDQFQHDVSLVLSGL
jgi:hypothetical protein